MLLTRVVPGDHPDALALLEACVTELDEMYGELRDAGTPSARPDELSPPHGGYVVLYDVDVPVAGGGFKHLAEGVAEIKCMYVVPERRGRGLARRLLDGLEAAAREAGYSTLRLDTGPQQPHAQRLYERAGYVAIENYNANAFASYWGEKRL